MSNRNVLTADWYNTKEFPNFMKPSQHLVDLNDRLQRLACFITAVDHGLVYKGHWTTGPLKDHLGLPKVRVAG